MKMLDAVDRAIIENLLEDSRLSLKDLAQRVNLSAPSVSERLRRLQDTGVIRAFTVDIDLGALGYVFEAIVRIRPLPGNLHIVERRLEDIPEISECDKVTGDDCFIARLHLRSMKHLDEVLDKITDKAETNTSIVKSQPVRRRLPPLTA
jgi:Lrp/AsnC family transcriptional regulator, leucine-responsive regulatory protein